MPKTFGFDSAAAFPTHRRDCGGYGQSIDAARCWRDSGVPERHKGKIKLRHDATGPWGETYRRLCDRLPQGPLIVLLGKRGTGKTQLAACLLADLCRAGGMVRYLKTMDLFREIRACYRPDGPNEVKTVNQLCRYAGLVLDEAHERSDSEWENRTLSNIVDRRYDAMRTTILVSNMTKEAFAQAVGPSIVSRIHESGEVVTCDWASFREHQRESN
ncbi:MAG TPA: ATP-binding protein [Tepidisphaeraceae bacterium]|nr:ATP-binding protein [Tepidisphaeraceae bacterium]